MATHLSRCDWDPKTALLYVVREDCDIDDSIEPFSVTDSPVWTVDTEGSTEYTYNWLR